MVQIIIDTREREIYEKIQEIVKQSCSKYDIIMAPLDIGDIIVKNDERVLLIIERKTINDLLASLKDGRYTEQCLRLQTDERCEMSQKVYLIEGNINAYDNSYKQTIYSSIASLTLFKGFNNIRTLTVDDTCNYVLMTANKIQKSLKAGKTFFSAATEPQSKAYTDVIKTCKKENVTPENISQIMLMQIPGISATTAKYILDGFDSLYDLMEKLRTNPNILENKTYELNGKPRKINKKCIESVVTYLS